MNVPKRGVFTPLDTALRTGLSPWLIVRGCGQLFDRSGLPCSRTAVEQWEGKNETPFHEQYKKLLGLHPTPLMPEDQQKLVAELPRDTEVVRVFKPSLESILFHREVNDEGKGTGAGFGNGLNNIFMLEARTISVLIAVLAQ
jgi:hypothetical protein